jgi:3'-phosphoadenosine 5'-phosphosulfate sulfotransferase (PAPS reductase)/FAD synthetase
MTELPLFSCEDCLPRDPEGLVHEAHDFLFVAINRYRPVKVFALFSGGHDSLCSTHVAASHPEFSGVVHINTGIGIEATRQFVRDTCAHFRWPLLELHPPPYRVPGPKRKPGIDYEGLPAYDAIVLHHGFPGPAGHGLMYTRLKERCLRRLVREHKRHRRDNVLLVGGMRLAESRRRMGTAEVMSREGCRAWCAPIINWTDEEKRWYMSANELPRNPVVNRLCMSGECLCGAFARPGEIVEVERVCPEAGRRIHALEARCRERGVPAVWGTRPPASEARAKDTGSLPETFFGLCWSCLNK